MAANNKSLPGNLNFSSAYAAIDARITCPAVPTMVMVSVFKRYLEKGTHDSVRSMNTSPKLSSVGRCGNNLGGKMNNSSSGLKALPTENITGISMNRATMNINMCITTLPLMVLVWFNLAILPASFPGRV
jgi:hypothetical protein